MARALKSRKARSEGRRGSVVGVELEARRLVVIDSDHSAWSGAGFGRVEVAGAIVWLRAPADAPEGIEDRVRQAVIDAGAYRVKKLARERATREVRPDEESSNEMPADEDDARRAMRRAAEELAGEVASGGQLERLLRALDEVLSEAGL
jgi:hypothetical protein